LIQIKNPVSEFASAKKLAISPRCHFFYAAVYLIDPDRHRHLTSVICSITYANLWPTSHGVDQIDYDTERFRYIVRRSRLA
jgi:hypothetical protein